MSSTGRIVRRRPNLRRRMPYGSRYRTRFPLTRPPGSYYAGPRGQTNPYKVVQFVDGGSNVSLASRTLTQGAAYTNGAIWFQLNDCPQATTFTAMFDQYRIAQVQVRFIPTYTNTTSAAGGFNVGLLSTVLDFDDTNALTFGAMQQYDNYQCVPCSGTKEHVRYVRPRISTPALVQAGTFTGSVATATQWIDCATPSVIQLGVKWGLDAYAGVNGPQVFQVMMKYWLEFRHVR